MFSGPESVSGEYFGPKDLFFLHHDQHLISHGNFYPIHSFNFLHFLISYNCVQHWDIRGTIVSVYLAHTCVMSQMSKHVANRNAGTALTSGCFSIASTTRIVLVVKTFYHNAQQSLLTSDKE